MQDHGAKRRAAHATIRDAHHVFHTGSCQFLRYGQIACFGHARSAFGADVFQHQNIVGMDIQVRVVNACGQVCAVFKHHSAALVFHQARISGRLFDDGTRWGQVAAQHRHAALWVNGVVGRTDDGLRKKRWCSRQVLTQGFAGDGECIQLQQGAQRTQQGRHAACMVKIFHVMLTRGFEVDQHRCFASHAVEGIEVHIQTHPTCHGRQMHQAVGGAANRQQHPKCILKSIGGQDLANAQAGAGKLNSLGAGEFSYPHAICRDGRR